MKHQCDYCSKELDRLMFCNHSHQVMYHKKGGAKVEKKFNPIITASVEITPPTSSDCKDCGYAKTLHGTKYIKCKEFKNII